MSNRANGILEHRILEHGAVRVADASGQGRCGVMRGQWAVQEQKKKVSRFAGHLFGVLQKNRKIRIS